MRRSLTAVDRDSLLNDCRHCLKLSARTEHSFMPESMTACTQRCNRCLQWRDTPPLSQHITCYQSSMYSHFHRSLQHNYTTTDEISHQQKL